MGGFCVLSFAQDAISSPWARILRSKRIHIDLWAKEGFRRKWRSLQSPVGQEYCWLVLWFGAVSAVTITPPTDTFTPPIPSTIPCFPPVCSRAIATNRNRRRQLNCHPTIPFASRNGIQFILNQFAHFALLSIEMAQTRCHGTAGTPGNSWILLKYQPCKTAHKILL